MDHGTPTPAVNPGAPSRTGARLLLLWAASVVVWWGIAFFPVPADDSWIAVAQSACFGSAPGGPPAAQGWIMLTLAPLLMLGALLSAWHAEIARALPSIARSYAWRAVTVALLGVFAIEATWAVTRVRGEARRAAVSFEPTIREPLPRDYPRSADPVPEFRLVDQSGATFDAASLRGQPTVLSFVFAHCQTVCPVLVATLRRAGHELPPGAARMALVTLDPWRDTPAALPDLAERFSLPATAHLLSGDPDAVCRLLDQMQVARERDLRTGDVSHVPIVMIVDAGGRVAYRFNNPPAAWIVEGVRRVRAGS
jgi:protein SCO1/2